MRDVEERDLRFLQRAHHVGGAAEVAFDGIGLDLAVIEQRVERLRRHRVDGIGPDDALDVHEVGVMRILRRGRRPERTLHRAALCLERRELVAVEDLLELLIGKLQAGDAGLAEQMIELFALGDALLQQLVDGRVDSADEDAS